MGINSFTNLEGCQVSVVDSGSYGGPNLALVQGSAGDGSLALMGVAQSAKRASCELALLYLVCWSACFTNFTHTSVNPFDCR